MTQPDEFIGDLITIRTRQLLISSRLQAMRGDISASINALSTALNAAGGSLAYHDTAAIGSLHAELLYLDEQAEEALSVFKSTVLPVKERLSQMAQFAVSDNLSSLEMASFKNEHFRRFYDTVDQRRTSGFEAERWVDIIEAYDAFEKGKANQALAPLWRNVTRAYRLGSWGVLRRAMKRYSRCCRELNAIPESCHFAIFSGSKSEVEAVSKLIDLQRDSETLPRIVEDVTRHTCLARDFSMACDLFSRIADVIPDRQMVLITEWALRHATNPPLRNGGGPSIAGWKLLRKIGGRLPSVHADRVLEIGTQHAAWRAPTPSTKRWVLFRDEIIKAVESVSHSASLSKVVTIVDASLELATSRVQDDDYVEVVSLLCTLAELGGDVAKKKIADILYAPGQQLNRVLSQVAETFGVKLNSLANWEALAARVTEELELMVQHVKTGTVPVVVPETLMRNIQKTKDGEVQVAYYQGRGLAALAGAADSLSKESVEKLVATILKQIENKRNILANKRNLMRNLSRFAKFVNDDSRIRILEALQPIAEGKVTARKPGNAMWTDLDSPENVQAAALVALTSFASGNPDAVRRIGGTLRGGFVNENAAVRAGAFTAAARLPELAKEDLLPVLMGLRDPDIEAACAAYLAFVRRPEWKLTRQMWELLLLGARLSSQSPNKKVRQFAAYSLKQLNRRPCTIRVQKQIRVLLSLFASDRAHSVRFAATNPDVEE